MIGVGVGLATMNATYKANSRRRKRTPFDKNLKYYKDEGVKKTFPKVSEIKLNAIREKIKKQERKERDKLIIAFVLAIPVSIGLIYGVVNFWLHTNV